MAQKNKLPTTYIMLYRIGRNFQCECCQRTHVKLNAFGKEKLICF